jgi:membrane-bound ClpP family serine protease
MTKQTKMLLGVGAVGVVAYFIYKNQQSKLSFAGVGKRMMVGADGLKGLKMKKNLVNQQTIRPKDSGWVRADGKFFDVKSSGWLRADGKFFDVKSSGWLRASGSIFK